MSFLVWFAERSTGDNVRRAGLTLSGNQRARRVAQRASDQNCHSWQVKSVGPVLVDQAFKSTHGYLNLNIGNFIVFLECVVRMTRVSRLPRVRCFNKFGVRNVNSLCGSVCRIVVIFRLRHTSLAGGCGRGRYLPNCSADTLRDARSHQTRCSQMARWLGQRAQWQAR